MIRPPPCAASPQDGLLMRMTPSTLTSRTRWCCSTRHLLDGSCRADPGVIDQDVDRQTARSPARPECATSDTRDVEVEELVPAGAVTREASGWYHDPETHATSPSAAALPIPEEAHVTRATVVSSSSLPIVVRS